MANRVLKDIRLYESEIENISGHSLPSYLGIILKPTKNLVHITQRIARKLNELNYSFGEQDHIYINLTSLLKENKLHVSNRNIDRRIQYVDFGIVPEKFNALQDNQKDAFIETKILEILESISNKNSQKLIEQTKFELAKYGRELKIHFKTKETKTYRIDIYYQVAPVNKLDNAIIEYKDKKNASTTTHNFTLEDYEDIYSLVDTIGVKNNKIILNPKKSFRAELTTKRYKTPITFELM
ncbi:hypothetical protein L0B52_02930 [Suttonella sp. R2A3]|uniref:hypothetical protein n=1 Tax=Suttonella sp. R2A3 TaxID=2908648 RepID=UPI001F417668|nr:hypothetical protein [Suttonella sp. R2A3]UJF25115.1 hypothetical protein L0B52_02930 [Suttonella sp. R2A3]